MDDLIRRQAAIDVVNKNTFRLTFAEEQNCEGHVAWSANAVYSDVMEGALLELPSVQPEITHCAECIHWKHSDVRKNFVRCKDCKYHSHDAEYGRDWCNRTSGVFRVKPDDFCSFAERRPDGN